MDLESMLKELDENYVQKRLPPEKIPCNETSDAKLLCKNPLVSIPMLAYNHEPYIRQAIEGVLMQKTNFEFELVIGEDASTDRTREICFEYQKRFPDKVRVLWSEENVFKIGGNAIRTRSHCRGKFIALCEGDDYWIDPNKLQKQVDLIEKTQANMCVAFNIDRFPDGREVEMKYKNKKFLTGRDFLKHYFHTSTYLINSHEYEATYAYYSKIHDRYDVTNAICMASRGRIALLPEIVSVYRRTGAGVATSRTNQTAKFMLLREYAPLYLYGPHQYRRRFGLNILSTVVGFCCPTKPGFSRELYEKKKKIIYKIFFYMLWKTFPSFRALNSVERMIRYHRQLRKQK